MSAVFRALEAGTICRSKAWLFADMCAELTPEQIEVVCARLLPHAGRLTTGELAARIKKLAIALDPDWAARRYATAVRERNVIGYLDPNGTATVTGTGLPVEQAAAAWAWVEELARTAKRAGHPAGPGAGSTASAVWAGQPPGTVAPGSYRSRANATTNATTAVAPAGTPSPVGAQTRFWRY